MELCLEEECRLCGLQISSMVVMQQHYEGKTHAKKVGDGGGVGGDGGGGGRVGED